MKNLRLSPVVTQSQITSQQQSESDKNSDFSDGDDCSIISSITKMKEKKKQISQMLQRQSTLQNPTLSVIMRQSSKTFEQQSPLKSPMKSPLKKKKNSQANIKVSPTISQKYIQSPVQSPNKKNNSYFQFSTQSNIQLLPTQTQSTTFSNSQMQFSSNNIQSQQQNSQQQYTQGSFFTTQNDIKENTQEEEYQEKLEQKQQQQRKQQKSYFQKQNSRKSDNSIFSPMNSEQNKTQFNLSNKKRGESIVIKPQQKNKQNLKQNKNQGKNKLSQLFTKVQFGDNDTDDDENDNQQVQQEGNYNSTMPRIRKQSEAYLQTPKSCYIKNNNNNSNNTNNSILNSNANNNITTNQKSILKQHKNSINNISSIKKPSFQQDVKDHYNSSAALYNKTANIRIRPSFKPAHPILDKHVKNKNKYIVEYQQKTQESEDSEDERIRLENQKKFNRKSHYYLNQDYSKNWTRVQEKMSQQLSQKKTRNLKANNINNKVNQTDFSENHSPAKKRLSNSSTAQYFFKNNLTSHPANNKSHNQNINNIENNINQSQQSLNTSQTNTSINIASNNQQKFLQSKQLQQKQRKFSTLKRKPIDLSKKFQYCSDLIKISKQQSINAVNLNSLNMQKEIDNAKLLYTQMMNNVRENLQDIIPLSDSLKQNLYQKESMDKKCRHLIIESSKCRNPILTVMSSIAYAKVCRIQRDYTQSILAYKQCKRQCVTKELLPYLKKCYKNLGYCYQEIKKNKVALVYFTKYLKLSFYLEDKDAELKAYDYMGLQYFYLGELEIAQYYHEKMFRGDYADQNSEVIKVIKNQIDVDLTPEGQKEKIQHKGFKMKLRINNSDDPYNELNGDNNVMNSKNLNDLEISSSEDEGIPINENIKQYINKNQQMASQSLGDLFTCAKNSKINLSNRQLKYLDTKQRFNKDLYQMRVTFNKSDPHSQQKYLENANDNIRIISQEMEKYKKFNGQIRLVKPSAVGGSKIKQQLTHLSVNRDLENYSKIDLRMNKTGFPKDFYDQFDVNVHNKVLKVLNTLNQNLLQMSSMIERIIVLKQFDHIEQLKNSAYLKF